MSSAGERKAGRMSRKRRDIQAEIDAMSPEAHSERLQLQMASDLKEIRNIIVAWWWLWWIGVVIVVCSTIAASS